MVAQGDPSTPGNLCFVSPADRTAGEFDLTTTCPGTVPIRVLVSPSLPPSHSLSLSLSLSARCASFLPPRPPLCLGGLHGACEFRERRIRSRTRPLPGPRKDTSPAAGDRRPNANAPRPRDGASRKKINSLALGFRSVILLLAACARSSSAVPGIVLVLLRQFHDGPPGTPFWCIAPDKGQVCICTASSARLSAMEMQCNLMRNV